MSCSDYSLVKAPERTYKTKFSPEEMFITVQLMQLFLTLPPEHSSQKLITLGVEKSTALGTIVGVCGPPRLPICSKLQ